MAKYDKAHTDKQNKKESITMDAKTLRQVKYWVIRPEAEPRAVQIDAFLGELYLGQYTFYNSSIKDAKHDARQRIKKFGSLN